MPQGKPNWGRASVGSRGRTVAVENAHHDFIYAEKEWFAEHGLDVSDPAFGRWVSLEDHKLWHNKMSPTFNEFWKDFIKLEEKQIEQGGSKFTIQQILDKLAEARSTYKVTNGN